MNPIKVLVVDDSAVVREVVTQLLRSVPGFDVSTAPDPIIAADKMRVKRPDVLVLDIEMPRMDGLTFLRSVMAEDPLPVVICSALAGAGTEVAMQALQAGAVDIIAKPAMGVRGFLQDAATGLVETVRAAARSRVAALPCVQRTKAGAASRVALPSSGVRLARAPAVSETTDKVLALGASTGGTEALRLVLEAMPPDAPGIVVVPHMPEMFTAAFARSLGESCCIEVKEAADGDRVRSGRALVAPGNRHLRVVRSGAYYVASLGNEPPVSRHRPSVDVLFESVARAAGPNAVGAIMTGMGDDGAAGLLSMKQAGAVTLAQDEESCVVFGMPQEAIRKGAVDRVVPLRLLSRVLLLSALER